MNRLTRRLACIAFLAVFAGLAVWWALVVPHRPEDLYRAIPANAAFVVSMTDPASRWDDLAGAPLVRVAAASAGLPPEQLERLGADPGSRAWIDRLASREVVIGYVPSLGYSGRPAWVMAAWIGGLSQRLRWGLQARRGSGLTAVDRGSTGAFWTCRPDWLAPGLFLSFALREGIALACVSSDPHAVRYLIAAHDRSPRVPSAASAGVRAMAGGLKPVADAADWGWATSEAWPGWHAGPDLAAFGWQELTATTMDLSVRAEWGTSWRGELETDGRDSLAARLAGLAEGWVRVPFETVDSWARSPASPVWLYDAAPFLRAAAGETRAPVLIAVYGGDYGGRLRSLFGGGISQVIKGLKVPTLVVAMPIGDPARCRAALVELLDRMNARYRSGLIPRAAGAAGAMSFVAVEDTGAGPYSRFEPDEQVAIGIADEGWLVVASNLDALRRIAVAAQTRPREAGGGDAWTRLAEEPAAAAGWFDLVRFGETARGTLAAASLALLMQDSSDTRQTRQRLAEADAWIETLEPLGRCELRLSMADGVAELNVHAGGAAP